MENLPVFTNDAVVLGLLMLALGFVFITSSKKTGPWAKFYKVVPALLMCYLIPAILIPLISFLTRLHSSISWQVVTCYLPPWC